MPFADSRHRAQRGSVLISLLLVMCLTVMVMSSLIVGSVEWLLANNSLRQTQALALAESGIEHAMMEITELEDLQAVLTGQDDTGSTADDGQVVGAEPIAVGDQGGTYSVLLTDNDDGDGDPAVDVDGVYYLFATGSINGVSQKIRVELDDGTGSLWTAPYGILTDDDLTIDSGVELIGPGSAAFSNRDVEIDNHRLDGGARAKDDLEIDSTDPEIEGAVMDAGEVDDYEHANDDQPAEEIPAIDPADFEQYAEYTLAADGKIYRPDGAVEFDTDDGDIPWGNWEYDGSGDWTLDGPTSGDAGAFYVDGNITVKGSGGTSSNPVELSLFAEGSVDFSGDFCLSARTGGVLAVTLGDVFVSGESTYGGSLLVHEQIKMQGNSTLHGVIIVEDGHDDFDLLDRTSEGTHLTDNTTIWPDGATELPLGSASNGLIVVEWREEH